MKSLAKNIISKIVQNDFLYSLLENTVIRLSHYANREREKHVSKYFYMNPVIYDAIKNVCPNFIVKHGVFKGMQYPKKTYNSIPFPHLLGSYERELQNIIEKIIKNNYTEIINIGCAEGYYAVGLAMRMPNTKIFAFDISKSALRQCREMAILNGVDDRIITGYFFDKETWKTISFTGKGLILCDCEGCEREIFTQEILNMLLNHDLLIEIHDFIDINISSYIFNLFKNSHDIEIIESIDDIKKVKIYNYKEIGHYDLPIKKILLGEKRPTIMEWFFIKSR
jgi:hypothetical protein